MEAKVKSFSPIKLLTSDEALERLFAGIESAEVKEELSKWFSFGLKDPGIRLSILTTEQLAIFLDKLPDILLVLYNNSLEIQKGADK
jgi:hypothetical protein